MLFGHFAVLDCSGLTSGCSDRTFDASGMVPGSGRQKQERRDRKYGRNGCFFCQIGKDFAYCTEQSSTGYHMPHLTKLIVTTLSLAMLLLPSCGRKTATFSQADRKAVEVAVRAVHGTDSLAAFRDRMEQEGNRPQTILKGRAGERNTSSRTSISRRSTPCTVGSIKRSAVGSVPMR